MSIYYGLEGIQKSFNNPVLTIGNFDGVHLGHLTLFQKVKERAKAILGQSVVMTFEPHPVKVVRPGNGPSLITPTEQKLKLIEQAGIDIVLCLSFDHGFASISAHDFVTDILVAKIGIREIVVGYDYTFGQGRKGNLELLRKMGKEYGFLVHVVGPIEINHVPVSSTSIRQLIKAGKLPEAKALLGRDYQLCGTVIKGEGRGGKLLGFPTANLRVTNELFPQEGVYAVKVHLDDQIYYGVTNIGHNPTFGNNTLSVETHIFDFSQDLLGKFIRIDLFERIRDEKKFSNIKMLTDQIALDIRRAREIFGLEEARAQVA